MTERAAAIKGSSISGLIEDIAKMRDEGRIPQALLEERLRADDRAILDQPVNLAGWYEIHQYRRLAELLCEIEGRRASLLRERGAAAARRLSATGIYQQIERVKNIRDTSLDGDEAFQAYGRNLRLITTLSGSMLNFTRFEVSVDPDHDDRYCITIHDADELPEVLAYTIEGFVNAMAELGTGEQGARTWELDRSDGLLRYRMIRAI